MLGTYQRSLLDGQLARLLSYLSMPGSVKVNNLSPEDVFHDDIRGSVQRSDLQLGDGSNISHKVFYRIGAFMELTLRAGRRTEAEDDQDVSISAWIIKGGTDGCGLKGQRDGV